MGTRQIQTDHSAHAHSKGNNERTTCLVYQRVNTFKLIVDWWELRSWLRKLSFHIKYHMIGR